MRSLEPSEPEGAMSETLPGFARRVAELLGVLVDVSVDPEASLFDDWGLDSLQAFQLIVIIESLAGALVPPTDIPEMFTVQDAYGYYCSLLADPEI